MVQGIDEVYQLAADMGGAGYIFTGEHDAAVMHNSATINLNVLEAGRQARREEVLLLFLGLHLSASTTNWTRTTRTAPRSRPIPPIPTATTAGRSSSASGCIWPTCANYGTEVRIARFHNIFGPEGTWQGGKEKAPAAISRKVAETRDGGEIEIWGDGQQTRSFLYIDECLEGVRRLMESPLSRAP